MFRELYRKIEILNFILLKEVEEQIEIIYSQGLGTVILVEKINLTR